jgi:hypothetical protein
MKADDVRMIRKEAQKLGIKYVTSYTKDQLLDKIKQVENKKALVELESMMTGVSTKTPIVPIIINVRVPKNKPYKLNIIHETL